MRAAVAGSPIGHSLSPVLHRAAYRALGLDGWSYDAIECDESGLAALLDSCGPGWAGLSLTMPLKRAVLPLLDRTDPVAAAVGAANTVVFEAGARHGFNTDVHGLVTSLTEAGAGDLGAALVLGAGATACSALAALRELGLRRAAVAVRDPARAAGLLAAAGRLGVRVELCPFGSGLGRGGQVLVSTVPAGAADRYARLLAGTRRPPVAVFDVVYDPSPTPLLAAADAVSAAVISGFTMLVHQAARQVTLMTGREPSVYPMRRAGRDALVARMTGGQA